MRVKVLAGCIRVPSTENDPTGAVYKGEVVDPAIFGSIEAFERHVVKKRVEILPLEDTQGASEVAKVSEDPADTESGDTDTGGGKDGDTGGNKETDPDTGGGEDTVEKLVALYTKAELEAFALELNLKVVGNKETIAAAIIEARKQ
jgi:hypothetical protein